MKLTKFSKVTLAALAAFTLGTQAQAACDAQAGVDFAFAVTAIKASIGIDKMTGMSDPAGTCKLVNDAIMKGYTVMGSNCSSEDERFITQEQYKLQIQKAKYCNVKAQAEIDAENDATAVSRPAPAFMDSDTVDTLSLVSKKNGKYTMILGATLPKGRCQITWKNKVTSSTCIKDDYASGTLYCTSLARDGECVSQKDVSAYVKSF